MMKLYVLPVVFPWQSLKSRKFDILFPHDLLTRKSQKQTVSRFTILFNPPPPPKHFPDAVSNLQLCNLNFYQILIVKLITKFDCYKLMEKK